MARYWVATVVVASAMAACSGAAAPRYEVFDEPAAEFLIGSPDESRDCSFDYRAKASMLDPADGALRWAVDIPWSPGPAGVSSDGVVVVRTGGYAREWPSFVAMDVESGAPRWQRDVDGGWPAIFVGTTVVTVDGRDVVGVATVDGAERWRLPIGSLGDVAMRTWEDRLVVVEYDGAARAVAVDSGAVVWTVPGGGGGGAEEPVAVGDLLVLASESGSMVAVDLGGDPMWTVPPVLRHFRHATTAAAGIVAFLETEESTPTQNGNATQLVAVDGETGSEVWRRPAVFGDELIAIGETLLLRTNEGGVTAVDPTTGGQVWTSADGRARAHPAAEGMLLMATYDELSLIDADTGEASWHRDFGDEVRSVGSPLVAGDMVYIGDTYGPDGDLLVDAVSSGEVRALVLGGGTEQWQVQFRDGVLAQPLITPAGLLVLSADGSIFCD